MLRKTCNKTNNSYPYTLRLYAVSMYVYVEIHHMNLYNFYFYFRSTFYINGIRKSIIYSMYLNWFCMFNIILN